MTTSGSSGRKGLFVYDRPEWAALIGQFLRYNAMAGMRPRLPRRVRVAAIGGASPSHMTRRVAQTVDVGLYRLLSLPVTLPLARLVEQLNRFQPQYMNAYPSIAVLLAEEQLARRLRISPERMSTSSEFRTPEMTARIEEAFGVRPFDLYGTTEGLWGAECDQHSGIHLFEDVTLVENVDEDGRPVDHGEPGARLVITSLVNRTQPLIRLELADAVTLDPEPCPCGRTLVRMRSIEGRSDDTPSCPPPATRAWRCTHSSSPSWPATARWWSSRWCRRARACACSSSPAARRRRSRPGSARRSSSASATWESPRPPSRSSAFPRSRASRAASSRSSSPTAAPARQRVRLSA
jgi:phenylacetate-CoA ligase